MIERVSVGPDRAEMAIDPEPLDLARDRLEVDRTEQGTWLEISSIEPNRA